MSAILTNGKYRVFKGSVRNFRGRLIYILLQFMASAFCLSCGQIETPVEPEAPEGGTPNPFYEQRVETFSPIEPFNIDVYGLSELSIASWQINAIKVACKKWKTSL